MSATYGLILAGGRGTRFWPRSRRASAKQVLTFFGDRSLIQQTVDRLAPVIRSGAHLDADQPSSARHHRAAASRGSGAADSGRACPAQHRPRDRPGGAYSGIARSRRGHGRVSRGPCDRRSRARTGVCCGPRFAPPGKATSWFSAFSRAGPKPATGTSNSRAAVQPGSLEPSRVLRFREKPDAAHCGALRALRQLLLERGHVFLARFGAVGRAAQVPAADCRASG